MAGGRKPSEDTLSSQIRAIFLEDRRLVRERSNETVKDRWKTKHQQKELPKNFDGILGNVKSGLRRKLGIKGRRGKVVASDGNEPDPANLSDRKLSRLGDSIDDCYVAARSLGRKGLEEVALLLKRARNRVVVLAGEKD
jgi:hypothetical protein